MELAQSASDLIQPSFNFLGWFISLAFMAIPVAVLGYALWMLTRLTSAVERIDERLQGDDPVKMGGLPDGTSAR